MPGDIHSSVDIALSAARSSIPTALIPIIDQPHQNREKESSPMETNIHEPETNTPKQSIESLPDKEISGNNRNHEAVQRGVSTP
jgi:hypothetical protein